MGAIDRPKKPIGRNAARLRRDAITACLSCSLNYLAIRERCNAMLVKNMKPPLMMYLIWSQYTCLAKEIATASIYGSSIDRTLEWEREHFKKSLAGKPDELKRALTALSDTRSRLKRAEDPQDLLLENGSAVRRL
jgi:hypothetical protein